MFFSNLYTQHGLQTHDLKIKRGTCFSDWASQAAPGLRFSINQMLTFYWFTTTSSVLIFSDFLTTSFLLRNSHICMRLSLIFSTTWVHSRIPSVYAKDSFAGNCYLASPFSASKFYGYCIILHWIEIESLWRVLMSTWIFLSLNDVLFPTLFACYFDIYNLIS